MSLCVLCAQSTLDSGEFCTHRQFLWQVLAATLMVGVWTLALLVELGVFPL
jgi:hypothetical protein